MERLRPVSTDVRESKTNALHEVGKTRVLAQGIPFCFHFEKDNVAAVLIASPL